MKGREKLLAGAALLCTIGACCIIATLDLPDSLPDGGDAGNTVGNTTGSGTSGSLSSSSSSSSSSGSSTSGTSGVACTAFDASACTQFETCNYTVLGCANGLGQVGIGTCQVICGLAGAAPCGGSCLTDDDCALNATCECGECQPVVPSGGGFTCDSDAGCEMVTPPHQGTPTCVCPACPPSPCSPFDPFSCPSGQYCEYTLIGCGDHLDNLSTAGQCDTPSDGGCTSDASCPADEACAGGVCEAIPCQEGPTNCAPGCQVLSVPHACGACVCDSCPLLGSDGGVMLPDGGICPPQGTCGHLCCTAEETCCTPTNLLPSYACMPAGSSC